MVTQDRSGPRHFIYPLNPDSPYHFEDEDGTPYPTDHASFLKLLDSTGRHRWGLSTNYLRVEDGDFIWAYFARPDGAIRAVGLVKGDPFWNPEWERHAIRIEWDRPLTRQLGRDPIRYESFRQRINAAVTEANDMTRSVLADWLAGRRRPGGAFAAIAEDVRFGTRQIKVRRGQRRFRADLMEAYDSRCVVTGCGEPEALEAAHIRSVSRKGRHSVRNGLLLRADIHTLFDRGLVVIDNDWTVRVHDEVEESAYRDLDGKRLTTLATNPNRPTKQTLRKHRRVTGWSS